MPITSATSPATLSETMRRVRLEKLCATKNSHAWRNALRTPPPKACDVVSAERSASAALGAHGVVRSSTWSRPLPRLLKARKDRLEGLRARSAGSLPYRNRRADVDPAPDQ